MRVLGSVPARITSGLALGQTLLLVVLPHGGQHAARRNAWAGMAADAQRVRSGREAALAVEAAGTAISGRELPRTGSR